MKLNIKYIDTDIILSNDYVFSFEINNKGLYYRLINDFNNISKGEVIDDIYLFEDLEEVNMSNNIMLIIDYFNIDFNNKNYLNHLNKLLIENINEKDIISINQYYNKIRSIILKNTNDINVVVDLRDEFNIQNIVKLYKVSINKKETLLEKLMLLIDIEKDFAVNKFIILVSIKQYLTKDELLELYKYSIYNDIKLMLIDYGQYGVTIENERKLIIDESLEEFML